MNMLIAVAFAVILGALLLAGVFMLRAAATAPEERPA